MENHPKSSSRDDLDYSLLRQLSDSNQASQRELAARLGVSVGKVNYCLRAVIDRGWVKVNNFRRADNKLAYAYVLTPSGLAEKLRLTRAFIGRKEREFENLQHIISELKSELGEDVSRDNR